MKSYSDVPEPELPHRVMHLEVGEGGLGDDEETRVSLEVHLLLESAKVRAIRRYRNRPMSPPSKVILKEGQGRSDVVVISIVEHLSSEAPKLPVPTLRKFLFCRCSKIKRTPVAEILP